MSLLSNVSAREVSEYLSKVYHRGKRGKTAGMPIIGAYKGVCSGHFHTNALLKAVMADKDNYEIIDMNELISGENEEQAVA